KHMFQEPNQNLQKINERFELTTLLPLTEWTKMILRTYLTTIPASFSYSYSSFRNKILKRLHFCPRPSGPNDTQNISYGRFL
ncbi:1828_t:CDS:1, partial [Racocetra persica]